MSNENDEAKIKVDDKRRFDMSGSERDDKEGVLDAKIESAPDAQQASNASDDQGLSFSSFVISLATQALIQMGQMEAPHEAAIPKDLSAAKQTIDLLAILEKKTKGNLDADEARLMEQVLHSLRLSYVQAVT